MAGSEKGEGRDDEDVGLRRICVLSPMYVFFHVLLYILLINFYR